MLLSFVKKNATIVALAVSIATYFAIAILTDPIHDYIFFDHTSVQDQISSCNYNDCITEDKVRAYNSTGWAIVGNIFALLTTLFRILVAYVVYKHLLIRLRIK